MKRHPISRWEDGTFRSRKSWQPEALDILCEDCTTISDAEYLEILRDGGREEREMWGDDLAVIVALWESWVDGTYATPKGDPPCA